jgi:hypothetical protein
MTVPRLSEPEELALLEHAAAAHGLESVDCPLCAGLGCSKCNGEGAIWTQPRPTCGDPECKLTARMAAIAEEDRRRRAS